MIENAEHLIFHNNDCRGCSKVTDPPEMYRQVISTKLATTDKLPKFSTSSWPLPKKNVLSLRVPGPQFGIKYSRSDTVFLGGPPEFDRAKSAMHSEPTPGGR